MKDREIAKLKLSKTKIATIKESTSQMIKGGTETISFLTSEDASAVASQCGNIACY